MTQLVSFLSLLDMLALILIAKRQRLPLTGLYKSANPEIIRGKLT